MITKANMKGLPVVPGSSHIAITIDVGRKKKWVVVQHLDLTRMRFLGEYNTFMEASEDIMALLKNRGLL